MVVEKPSTRYHFGGVSPFKVQVEIHLFEVNIDANALEKWLNLLEGYFSVQKFSYIEKITFTLFKVLPHVKDWWKCYWKIHDEDDSKKFRKKTTWVDLVGTLEDELFSVGNYDYQYMRWKTLCQEIDQMVPMSSIPCTEIWVSKTLSGTWI
jgi:hypothetical protein